MYFDTIHNLPEFDEVCAPEDGYASYWETDTEIDEELGNLIFSNVPGDSASVICIDEAMDLLAVREQRLLAEREEAVAEEEEEEERRRREFCRQDKESDRSGDRHSRHSSASRHSHHSGSDGTYEGPVQANISRMPSNAHDHVYETLDDCRAEFRARVEGIYVSKSSDGSRESTDSTAKLSDNVTPRTGAARPTHRSTKHRSVSLSQPSEGIIPYHIRHRRKLSEGTEFLQKVSKTRPERTDRVAPKSCSPPAKGYSYPSGMPRDYADYVALPGAPASPERRHSSHQSGKKKLPPPSLIIKHKGKTYLIPVVDKKTTQQKSKAKGAQEAPKHTTLNTLSRSNSTAFSTSVYNANGTIGRRHCSPPKAELTSEQPHRKNKSKQSTTQGAQASGQAQAMAKQVTHIHYGVV